MTYELIDQNITRAGIASIRKACEYKVRDFKVRDFKVRPVAILLTVASLLLLASCREDMQNQPKFIPLRENPFYADGRSARAPVEGTIARGQLQDDPLLYTGKVNGQEVDQFPFSISQKDLARGRERFNIFCSPCHSQLGEGNGMIALRGFKNPPSYFEPRLMKAPVGHFFNVMTNGWGAMGDYSAQVPVSDRWRIAAYIRALQLSRTAQSGDVPAGQSANHAPQQGGEITGTRMAENVPGNKEAK